MTEATAEELLEFRHEARRWLAENMPRQDSGRVVRGDPFQGRLSDAERVRRARQLQKTLFDGGYAGLVFPAQYGGRGLPPEYQQVFAEEAAGYQMPLWLNASTLAIVAPTLLEFGTEEQRLTHIPAILRGEEFWAQLLSEPTGGSDLAGAVTSATRQGDTWILNGAKIWTSGAHLRDFGLCLARTDWDVPKHRGLSVFIVDLRQPGVSVVPIRQANGSSEFCQEFFDQVVLADTALVGKLNDGWTVASRMLFHERRVVGGASPYAGVARARGSGRPAQRGPEADLLRLAADAGRDADPVTRQLIGEAHVLATVRRQLVQRVTVGVRRGKLPAAAGSLQKLMTATASARIASIGLEIAEASGVVCRPGNDIAERVGRDYLVRQASCIGGGTNEIQRNMISERLLGMPKEPRANEDGPFRDARRTSAPR
jgi:alkylation response protein AidB-like acyl-CoA dehydrogenase